MGRKKNFPHILTASSTLLGLCFVVLTSLKLRDDRETSIVDALTAAAILLFMVASMLSYLSMRSAKSAGKRFEQIADIAFLVGLIMLFAMTILIMLNVIE